MAYGITDLATFILGTIFIVLLPGPNSLYVMTVASRHGIAAGYRGAAGIFAGDTVLMLLSTAGAASLLRSTPLAFTAIKYTGAAYLAWLGLGLLRAAFKAWRQRAGGAPVRVDQAPAPRPDAGNPMRTAFVISLMNPKAILFFVAWYPNLSGLPLPSDFANIYQGLLPTWNWDFQFAVNTDPAVEGSTIGLDTLVLGALSVLVVVSTAIVARRWGRLVEDEPARVPAPVLPGSARP